MPKFLSSLFILLPFYLFAQFTIPEVTVQPPASQNEIFPMDLDGDGDQDIITTNGDGIITGSYFEEGLYYNQGHLADNFRICVNDGTGTFTEQALLTLSSASLWDFGFIDGDNRMDFIYTENNNVYYRHHSPGLSFDPAVMIFENIPLDCSDPLNDLVQSLDQIKRVTIGDLNTDGIPDVLFGGTKLICSEGIAYPDMYFISLYVCYGNGTSFDPAEIIYTFTSGSNSFEDIGSLEIMDTNGDGTNEIFAATGYSQNMWMISIIENSSGYYDGYGFQYLDEIVYDHLNGGDLIDVVGFLNNGGGYSEINIDWYDQDYASQWVYPAINTGEFVSSSRFDIIDLYGDGFGDFVVGSSEGTLEFLINNNDPDVTDFPNTLIWETGVEDVLNMRSADLDGDGLEDLILMTEGNVYVLSGSMDNISSATITSMLFFDDDNDGEWDGGEEGYPYQQVQVDDFFFYTHADGSFAVNFPSGVHSFTPLIDHSIFEFTTEETFSVDASQLISDTILYFGITPIGGFVSHVDVHANSTTIGCNPNEIISQSIQLNNTGNTLVSGVISYVPDQLLTFSQSFPAPDYVSDDTLFWEYHDLNPGQSFSVLLGFIGPNQDATGEMVLLAVHATILDEFGNEIFSDTDRDSYVVMCAFDPNDITEENGWTEQGFILNEDEMEFTIRFQNTGNAPATNVRLENQLSGLLQWNTLEPVGWSHPFELSIDENGRSFFYFNNINLPDSISDELGSHGYVTYVIHAVPGLNALTEIFNSAEIYFDFNDPVITNTEVNTIFDCAIMTGKGDDDVSTCVDQPLQLYFEVAYADSYTWTQNDIVLVDQPSLTWTPSQAGTFLLTLTAVNPLCEVSFTTTAVVNPFPEFPIITQTGNSLYASGEGNFTWMLNDEIIEGETGNSIEISESGIYMVIVEMNGCAASNNGFFLYSDVSEQSFQKVMISPNPFTSQTRILLPIGNWNVDIMNSTGEIIRSEKASAGGTIILERKDMAIGMYYLKATSSGQTIYSKVMVE